MLNLGYGALVTVTEQVPGVMRTLLASAAGRVRDLDERRSV